MEELSPLEWAVRPLKRYADFKGRASRPEYWWFWLGYMLFGLLFQVMIRISPILGLLGLLYLGIIIPMIAVGVRRLHDTNRSGFWLLAPIGPYGLGLGMMISSTRFGEGPPTLSSALPAAILVLIGVVLAIVVFIFTVLPGTKGPNRFGPDPRDENNLEEIFT